MAEISIIVPVYNEAEHVLPFYYELRKHIPSDYELVWVDDGSTDTTLQEIEELTMKDSRIKCVSLTRNFGQTSAVSAGLDFAIAPSIIIMNGNLKNPPSVLPLMLAKLKDGFEVVNTSVNNQQQVFFLQKLIFDFYAALLNKLAPHRNDNDITSFRAINYKVIEGIHQLKENNLLLGNFFSWAGYKTTVVTYNCNKCSPENQKYSFAHLVSQTRKTIQYLHPGVFKSFFYTGLIFLFTGMAIAVWQSIILLNGALVNNKSIVVNALVLIAGIFLLIQSKKPQRAQLAKKTRMPGYLIKDVIEQEKNSYNLSF